MFGYNIEKAKEDKGAKNIVRESNKILQEYKSSKSATEAKVIENEKWFRSQHWDIINKGKKGTDQEAKPVTGYLFNTISNKHADAMDNYPLPNTLPREQDDEKESKRLSSVIPVILENIKFRNVYSEQWWEKLKHGTAIYHIGWDAEAEEGIGDISVKGVDILTIYWQSGIEDIQDSMNIFVVDLVHNDTLKEMYPDKQFRGTKEFDFKEYAKDDSIDTSNMSMVVDRYYKKRNEEGKQILCYLKYCGDNVLYNSLEDEEHPEYAEEGYYAHNKYPYVFDPLFPIKNSPIGFGYIDIIKNPQMYIDKLDQIISNNALMSGKNRWFKRDNSKVNMTQFLDWSQPLVDVEGKITEDDLRMFTVKQLDASIHNHRNKKIDELKEISSTNEFSRGEGGKGVTAAAAISALQEAGNKTSRDMIGSSYEAYSSIVYYVIELIRQFYAVPRTFRVDSQEKGAGHEYVSFDNSNIKVQENVIEGMEEPTYRKPLFDIKVTPEKRSPFSQMAHNELAKELYGAGFFDPQRAEQALLALEMMKFEGKETIIDKIKENQQLLQQVQELTMQMQVMAKESEQMKAIIQANTGANMGVNMESVGEMQ